MNRNTVVAVLLGTCWIALDYGQVWGQPYALVPHTTAHLRLVPHHGHYHAVPQFSTHFHLVPTCQFGGCYGPQSLGANGPRRLRPYRYSFDPTSSRTVGSTKVSSAQGLGLQSNAPKGSPGEGELSQDNPIRYLLSKRLSYYGSGVRIRMPDTLDTKLTMAIDNDTTLDIHGGQERHLKDKGTFLVRFSRGKTDDGMDAGEAQVSVFEGVYWIVPTESGLDLVRQEEIDFSGSDPNQAKPSRTPNRSLASRLLDPLRTLPIPPETKPDLDRALVETSRMTDKIVSANP